MQPAALLALPPLADTGHTRESLLHALAHGMPLPSTEVAVATLHAEEIEPDVIAVLERAGREELDPPSKRLLFRGLHILGGRRLAAGYRPLIAFLRGPQERVDDVLGDTVTDSLSRIIAGMFDGDVEPLLALIMDLSASEYVRHSAMGALTFLAFDGRVERAKVERFLERFEADRAAPAGDHAWDAWMAAVGLLGFESLSERVGAAFRDGRIQVDVNRGRLPRIADCGHRAPRGWRTICARASRLYRGRPGRAGGVYGRRSGRAGRRIRTAPVVPE